MKFFKKKLIIKDNISLRKRKWQKKSYDSIPNKIKPLKMLEMLIMDIERLIEIRQHRFYRNSCTHFHYI